MKTLLYMLGFALAACSVIQKAFASVQAAAVKPLAALPENCDSFGLKKKANRLHLVTPAETKQMLSQVASKTCN